MPLHPWQEEVLWLQDGGNVDGVAAIEPFGHGDDICAQHSRPAALAVLHCDLNPLRSVRAWPLKAKDTLMHRLFIYNARQQNVFKLTFAQRGRKKKANQVCKIQIHTACKNRKKQKLRKPKTQSPIFIQKLSVSQIFTMCFFFFLINLSIMSPSAVSLTQTGP